MKKQINKASAIVAGISQSGVKPVKAKPIPFRKPAETSEQKKWRRPDIAERKAARTAIYAAVYGALSKGAPFADDLNGPANNRHRRHVMGGWDALGVLRYNWKASRFSDAKAAELIKALNQYAKTAEAKWDEVSVEGFLKSVA